ncbi:MAG: hypothetical protein V4472_23855 [Pseudomonadota bacterium]
MATSLKSARQGEGDPLDDCARGRHRVGVQRIDPNDRDIRHSTCRVCGCELAYSRLFRRWSICGKLG